MFDNIKHNIPSITIALGYFVYILLIIQTTFSIAALWMMFVVYVWLLSAICLGKYTFNSFLYIVCSSGIALSVAFFFLQGVEELPFPEGALMFHADGIAKAFFLFFVCTVPMIIMKFHNNKRCQLSKKENKEQEAWEQASPEDIRSGNYERL